MEKEIPGLKGNEILLNIKLLTFTHIFLLSYRRGNEKEIFLLLSLLLFQKSELRANKSNTGRPFPVFWV
jgi:hypothetical protein